MNEQNCQKCHTASVRRIERKLIRDDASISAQLEYVQAIRNKIEGYLHRYDEEMRADLADSLDMRRMLLYDANNLLPWYRNQVVCLERMFKNRKRYASRYLGEVVGHE